jgi:hypothetical protein
MYTDDQQPPVTRRVLSNLRHGGHVMSTDLVQADPDAVALHSATIPEATGAAEPEDVADISTPFGYLFRDLRDFYPGAHLPVEPATTVVTGLKALGSAMIDQPEDDAGGDSTIPPIYTYWGQFVDHDLTANTDRNTSIGITDLPLEPLAPERVLHDLRNLRQPQLNLDSVYGNGPGPNSHDEGQVPFTGDKFELGALASGPPDALPGDDLPRIAKAPQIGDGRNDENLVIAQIQVSFLKFHNAVIDWFASHPGHPVTGAGDFARAKQLTQLHYQWITVHDFLRTIAMPEIVDGLLDGTIEPIFTVPPGGETFMPLEFSVAAYRFGHSMVRGKYDWNANFGAPGTRQPSAPFNLLFAFTGGGGFFGAPSLPSNWPAQFERMTGAQPRPDDAPQTVPVRFARKIDTHLAPPLGDLRNEGTDPALSERISRIMKRLAVRNLLRGYRLAIPTGQAVANALGIVPLTTSELLSGDQGVRDALIDGNFVHDTPLWFYVLKEAEVLAGGNHLGPVGSRIVAETILGQLRADPDSFLSQNWDPSQGVPVDAGHIDTIISFLRFAGTHAPAPEAAPAPAQPGQVDSETSPVQ